MNDLFILKDKEKIIEMANNSKIFTKNIGGTANKISEKLIGILNEDYLTKILVEFQTISTNEVNLIPFWINFKNSYFFPL